jgi:hypothetical protein
VTERQATQARQGPCLSAWKEGDWLNDEVVRGPFSHFFFWRSAMDASVVKVAPMAWGFLQKENGGVQ